MTKRRLFYKFCRNPSCAIYCGSNLQDVLVTLRDASSSDIIFTAHLVDTDRVVLSQLLKKGVININPHTKSTWKRNTFRS